MADKETKKIEVDESMLVAIQEQMAEMERKQVDLESKNAGLEALVASNVSTNGDLKLKEKKNFEPKFRTVTVSKYPIAGDENNLGYIVGWTSKGAYQEVDRSGLTPQIVDYIDVIFLGQEKTKDGKIKAEKIKLLDLMNKGIQLNCKIIDTERKDNIKVPTGEEIDVSVYDPAHGLINTGDKVDGYYAYSEIKYKIQIPGVDQPVLIDSLFCNAF